MRKLIYQLFNELKNNSSNRIVYYRNNIRNVKTFKEFATDIDCCLSRLNFLKEHECIKTIAILGPISYEWCVCDFACIKGGFLSVAIPENLPINIVQEIVKETNTDLLLLGFSLKEKFSSLNVKTYYIECDTNEEDLNVNNIPESTISSDNLTLEEYSIVFSSGTSDKIKYIKKVFPEVEKKNWRYIINHISKYIKYKLSFWSRKDNKLIIFMPFSHPQQRDFFRTALLNKFSVILSDSINCLKHIIIEKPNILVSVPVVYEAMAARINSKIKNYDSYKKWLFSVFNKLRINSFSNWNPIKRIFSQILFRDIKKIYGGRADFFVTGSAPISPEVTKTFYSVGVKLLEAYGQTETGNIAMNTPANFKIGSVGKPLVEIKISEESEILVKYNPKSHAANNELFTIDKDEYIHTGDLGYLDKKGFLYITGRKDNVLVLENGKKIFPENIETCLKRNEIIRDAVVFSPDGYKVYAIVESNYNVEPIEIQKYIIQVNTGLPIHENISKVHVTREAFSIENGTLTSTYKKRRGKIGEIYKSKDFLPIA